MEHIVIVETDFWHVVAELSKISDKKITIVSAESDCLFFFFFFSVYDVCVHGTSKIQHTQLYEKKGFGKKKSYQLEKKGVILMR
jgi:hypothetical protein